LNCSGGVGPQPHIDPEDVAVGRALLQQPEQRPGHADKERARLDAARERGRGRIVEHDEIDIAGIVELERAHLAHGKDDVAAALLGEKPQIDPKQANGPDDIKTKDQIIKFLKDSFAQSHKAVQTITNKNVTEMVPSPFDPKDKEARLALGNIFTWHSFDHYGQMAVYLRMNGIIPPASRK